MRSQLTAASNFGWKAENALILVDFSLGTLHSRERGTQSTGCMCIWKNQIMYQRIQSLAFVTDGWNSKKQISNLEARLRS